MVVVEEEAMAAQAATERPTATAAVCVEVRQTGRSLSFRRRYEMRSSCCSQHCFITMFAVTVRTDSSSDTPTATQAEVEAMAQLHQADTVVLGVVTACQT